MTRIRPPPFWLVSLVIAGVLAVALALAIVIGAFFLVVFPVVAIGAAVARFLWARSDRGRQSRVDIIEAEYTVIADKADMPDKAVTPKPARSWGRDDG